MKKQQDKIFILNPELDNKKLLVALSEYVHKLTAMVVMIGTDDFIGFDVHYIRDYFWAIEGIVDEIAEINQIIQTRF